LMPKKMGKHIEFQSTHLYKVRQIVHPYTMRYQIFQSMHLYKVRPVVKAVMSWPYKFQSTHLYEVRLPNIS
ncbi:hypothetical protein, partial [Bacillus cereus group sp. BfR-BA-01449]|uniref:hypothetical protein n=1 Tax=Bacillus cereus group sp. BfR-BA-01449 TaxID=2920353 RepID=UPI001F56FE66